MKRLAVYLAAALAAALAACSPAAEDEPAAEASEPVAAAPTAPRAALSAEDIEGAVLTGELSCAFVERGVRAPLLVASADVDDAARPVGVLKLGSSTIKLESAAAGGFNAMVDGARFASGDLTAAVSVTSLEPLDDSESPPLAAVLELGSAALGTQRIAGEWSCGP
jgi:hypothetical protein